ncbi:MAG: hypothetical protein DRQ97_13890, partial [Gammaproteobacteria bacterium]
MNTRQIITLQALLFISSTFCFQSASATDWWKQYGPQQTVRENVFTFTEKPAVKYQGNDRYDITFTVKAYCDVTVGLVDKKGKIIRHLASG